MKKRLLALLCVCVCLFGTTMGAFAAYVDDVPFTMFTASASGFNYNLPSNPKSNNSPVYLYYTKGTYSYVRVKAKAFTSSGSAVSTEVTENGLTGNIVSYVTCYINNPYSIHTQIFEKGYRRASLTFRSSSTSYNDYISGLWSSDSQGTYTHATQ